MHTLFLIESADFCYAIHDTQKARVGSRTHGALNRRTGAVGAKCQFAVGERVAVNLTAVTVIGPCTIIPTVINEF